MGHLKLYDRLKPESYKLHISIDEKDMTFSGSVEIDGQFFKGSAKLLLHSDNLDITSVTVNDGPELKHATDKHLQILTIELTEPLEPGSVSIKLEFNANVSESMVGLYPSKFSYKGKDDVIFGTQFESHHAREVFPCIDEPAAKARFSLSLETRPSIVVLSNSKQQSQETKGNRMLTVFDETPLMSTYLLAFVCGNLKYLEKQTKKGVKLRTWATPDHYKSTDFALDCTDKALALLEDFFGIDYPLEKCDLVALPEFAAGAMENWGLITYRESALLIDDHSSLAEKQRVAEVVTHELAHQWFGNLVTMDWWNDLWLNESFASFMAFHIVDQIYPEWNLWLDQIAYDVPHAQNLDRLQSSHPIEIDIDDPKQIRTVFDAISYEKGAIVLGMLRGYVGDEDFKKGLRIYIEKHKYSNTITADLWSALSEASGKDVVEFMESWTTQTGFPLVKVTSRDSGISLSQQRYALVEKPQEGTWQIPIHLGNKMRSFNDKTTEYEESPKKPINRGYTGFYVTEYDESLLEQFISDIDNLNPTEKIGLVADLFSVANIRDDGLPQALGVLPKLTGATDSAIWSVIIGEMHSIRYKYIQEDESLQAPFNSFVRQIIESHYQRLGWEPKKTDSVDDKIMRPWFVGQAVNAKHPDAISQVKKLSGEADPTKLSSQVRNTVIKYLAMNDQGSYDKFKKLYNKAISPSLRQSYSIGLTQSTDPNRVESNFEMIKNNDVRLQDLLGWLAAMLSNPISREATWTWIQTEWPYLRNRYGNDMMTQSYVPKIVSGRLLEPKHLEEYRAFFTENEFAFMFNKVQQGDEELAWATEWRKNNYQSVRNWLKEINTQ